MKSAINSWEKWAADISQKSKYIWPDDMKKWALPFTIRETEVKIHPHDWEILKSDKIKCWEHVNRKNLYRIIGRGENQYRHFWKTCIVKLNIHVLRHPILLPLRITDKTNYCRCTTRVQPCTRMFLRLQFIKIKQEKLKCPPIREWICINCGLLPHGLLHSSQSKQPRGTHTIEES